MYFAENTGMRPGERIALSYDAIKFSPGLQRSSLKEEFYGFISNYNSQGQIDVQKVIQGKQSKEEFLEFCCANNFLGDYLFVFFI